MEARLHAERVEVAAAAARLLALAQQPHALADVGRGPGQSRLAAQHALQAVGGAQVEEPVACGRSAGAYVCPVVLSLFYLFSCFFLAPTLLSLELVRRQSRRINSEDDSYKNLCKRKAAQS